MVYTFNNHLKKLVSFKRRDYRSISAEEFVESIEMKMRWLARRLRRLDKPNEITQWVITVSSINDLLQKIKSTGATSSKECGNRRGTSTTERTKFSISVPHMIIIEDDKCVKMNEDVGEEMQVRVRSPHVNIANTLRRKVSKGKRKLSPQRAPKEEVVPTDKRKSCRIGMGQWVGITAKGW